MKKTVFSLALATFGLGMAEFGIMGVLTELANNVGISIPSAGHMISAYAAGGGVWGAGWARLGETGTGHGSPGGA